MNSRKLYYRKIVVGYSSIAFKIVNIFMITGRLWGLFSFLITLHYLSSFFLNGCWANTAVKVESQVKSIGMEIIFPKHNSLFDGLTQLEFKVQKLQKLFLIYSESLKIKNETNVLVFLKFFTYFSWIRIYRIRF